MRAKHDHVFSLDGPKAYNEQSHSVDKFGARYSSKSNSPAVKIVEPKVNYTTLEDSRFIEDYEIERMKRDYKVVNKHRSISHRYLHPS